MYVDQWELLFKKREEETLVWNNSVHCMSIVQCTVQWKGIVQKKFSEKELRALSPNSYIYVSVSDFYISKISLPVLL